MVTTTGPIKASDRVLVVEDADEWRQMLTVAFSSAGYATHSVGDGRDAVRAFFDYQPDLVVLDIMLPGINGTKVCEHIRSVSGVPVIIHSGLDRESGKIEAFQSGADDYVVKGTGMRELVARARANLRRVRDASPADKPAVYRDGAIEIDHSAQTVTLRGSPVTLTPIEFRLLSTLAADPGRTFPAADLLSAVWGPEYATPALVKWHIGRLRKKIELDPVRPELIITRWGYGYSYLPPGETS